MIRFGEYLRFANVITIASICIIQNVSALQLVAYVSHRGLHGEIKFRQVNYTTVEITSKLETTLQYPDQAWSWSVRMFPVDYTNVNPIGRCELDKLGAEVVRFDNDLGLLVLPGNESTSWNRKMQLVGEEGIWGKSLLFTDIWSNDRICATITTIEMSAEYIAEARFTTPIAGSVYFRWLTSSQGVGGDTLIYSDLYHVQNQLVHEDTTLSMTQHRWKIYVTDILENDHHRSEENCNFLQQIFDPLGSGDGHGIGDLDDRLGRIRVATNALRNAQRVVFHDNQLLLLPSDLTIPHRTLYLVLFDNNLPKNFLACTKIRYVKTLTFKTFVNSGGIKGEITFIQRSKFDPTFLNFTVFSAGRHAHYLNRKFAEDVAAFRIHDLPPNPQKLLQPSYCDSTGGIYNPFELEKESIPPPGFGTQDQYPLGDLSGKLQSRNKDYYHNYLLPGASSELSGLYWDTFLPLQGTYSIAHRSFVIYTYNRTNFGNITESPWSCSTIYQYQGDGVSQEPILTAQVLFRYPIVGRVLFRQPAKEPWRDTTILFEYLIHADGSTQNNSFNHRWAIHNSSPGKDFYDWQNRCSSTGNVFNPYRVDWGNHSVDDFCKPRFPSMCPLGALGTYLGSLSIAGNKRIAEHLSRRMFTVSNLPLSGRHSILGRSLVIYDDFGPQARGERLACSIISRYYCRKVVAKNWYANGYDLTVNGKVEITQQSEYDLSNIEISMDGLDGNSGYHIHLTPVEANLAFPCEASTLYGHWNPAKINPKLSPPPKQGTSDQYEMGDLSGKFGTLDDLKRYQDAFNDTNLPLFGLYSIIGRSIVIHKKNKNVRWACSTLERGYNPSEARELRAIASFHHPAGFVYGYIKMTQLVHNDGSQSETVIEVNLRYPGKHNRNMTWNHDWQIFVNPVDVDATVKSTSTRCVAGGYVWNPYFTQLADPLNRDLYDQECGPDNPLRCYVGDVGSRLGPINLGVERVILTDSNIPLETPFTAIGRSIVIFGPEFSHERFACANIEPDHNVIKYINLQKPPRFVVAQFLEELRSVMGVPEWMLDVDARKTKELHGGSCVQMVIHFKGPLAHRLELDMSRLIAAGRLDAPSLYIAGYVNQERKATISYRTCGARDLNEKLSALQLVAYVSHRGLHGEIKFRQVNYTTVEITSKLETTLQYPDQAWSWSVRMFPVDYTNVNPIGRCELDKLGAEVVRFDNDLGLLVLPGNESTSWNRKMQLVGEEGIWGKSLLFTDIWSNDRICATITTIEMSAEYIAEARFTTPIAGSVYFRWLTSSQGVGGDTLIYSDLYHVQNQLVHEDTTLSMTQHRWKIYVTDILENDHHRSEENCNFLQQIFDPLGSGDGHGIGDLDDRLGRIRVATNALRNAQRVVFHDNQLLLLPSDLTIPHRTLYLVLFDNNLPKNFLACTKIRYVKTLTFKTFVNSGGIKGEITFIQRSKFDPTFLNFTVFSAGRHAHYLNRKFAEDVAAFRIHDLPPNPQKLLQPSYCDSTGGIYNPFELEKESIPPPGFGTQDQYPLGDLSGKLQSRNKDYYHNYLLPGASSELSGLYWDTFLPLQGTYSIAHRSFVIYTYNRTNFGNITESPWSCSTIYQYQGDGVSQEPILTAQVLFRYPIVGRVLFRQPAKEPWRDTTILFEYLIHADGSTQNNSFNHRWAIHNSSPGKDFYDWQNRCSSTGNVFNPYRVDWGNHSVDDFCKPRFPSMCPLGALGTYLGSLSIAGNKRIAEHLSRRMFTVSNLPLSGRHSILGRSLVIYDDFGPQARGERLACSIISRYYCRKVVAKNWYANGYDLTVNGKVEITQQSEYDLSNIEISMDGLDGNSGYHIHLTPVEANLAFPCEASTLYGHWNPAKINPKLSPPPKQGTSDQYEMGDLSGKFGTLDDLKRYQDAFNDTNLPLFGLYSIIGRSIVIHKKNKNVRWACSTLERGYNPSEARELRAIASFHHPAGFVYGYIKMTQLVHNDGSQSETVIEVNLRYPGKHNRNMTWNHDWQIFVNPVDVDATVKSTSTRCVAGGYVWNPYFTQLADPLNRDLYDQECGPDNPLRCYVGDVGSRLGPINLGVERVILTDSNIPLETPFTAIGRSIVIFGPEFSHERFACANIEPDHNVIKYINLQKPPRFVVAQFLEELRSVMGVPEWMLDVDARKTKELHGGSCVQMVIHFKGPLAHRLELDMSRLIAAGRLDAPSLYIAGYVNQERKATISYRTCGARDLNEKREKSWKRSSSGVANPGLRIEFRLYSIYLLSCTYFTLVQQLSWP